MVQGRPFSGDDENLFIEALRKNDSLKERLFELYLLYSISKNFNVSTEIGEIFGSAIDFLRNAMEIEEFCLMLLDEGSGELRVWNDNGEIYEAAGDVSLKLGEGIAGRVAESGEAILVPDAACDERFLFYKGRLPEIGSFLSVPIKAEGGRVVGVLNIHKRETRAFRESDKLFFNAVAMNLGHALERARRFEDVQRDAMYDELTRLYNRRFFIDSLRREFKQASRSGESLSVIMIDIDHFKQINDTHGHLVGDRVLAKLACALRTSMRQSDIVARLGGEEFVVLLPGTGKEGAMLAAEKFRALVEEELIVEAGDGATESVTITAGVATWPGDGDTHESLLDAADRFMYRGKHEGRNRVMGQDADESAGGSDDERRRQNRYRTAMRIVRDDRHVGSLEMRCENGDWNACTLVDVSRAGFNCTVYFEPKPGTNYVCRVVGTSDAPSSDPLAVRLIHARSAGVGRWLMGVEVDAGDLDRWQRIYSLLLH